MDPELIAQMNQMQAEGAPAGNTNQQPPPPPVDYAALFKQQQEANALLTQQLAQLAQSVQQQPQQSIAPAEDIFKDVDPATQQLLQKFGSQITNNIKSENTKLQQQLAELTNQLAINKIGSSSNVPPAIQQRAQLIYAGMAKNGTPLTPDDALKFAIGEAVTAGTYVPQRPSNQPPPPNVLSGGSRQPVRNNKIPDNIDELHWSEQISILQAAGVDREEF